MRFVVDAHLPRSLSTWLVGRGHDSVHTLDLPDGNETKDRSINQLSVDQQRVVISKDADFFYSHLLHGRPWKLVLVRTGNISTQELKQVFVRNFEAIESALETHSLVELDRDAVRPQA